jgi:hypothetical protein
MDSTNKDVRPLTDAEIDAVAGGSTLSPIITYFPPGPVITYWPPDPVKVFAG